MPTPRQTAFREGIALGHKPQPATFTTPDGAFTCCACGERKPNETCVGWVKPAENAEDLTHGVVCAPCYDAPKKGEQ